MTDILSGLIDLLTGDLSQLTDNLVAIGLALFALALGFFAIGYLNRRRQMLHQERMASLIKGLHYAGVAREVFAKPTRQPREHMLSGMRWLFGGAGVAGAMYGYESMQPSPDAAEAIRGALVGVIPGALGLAQLLFGWICSRRDARHGQIGSPARTFVGWPSRGGYRPGTYYRPAARRA